MYSDKQIADNLDDWAERIVEKIFQKETIGIPRIVCVQACLKFLALLTAQEPTLYTEETVLALVKNSLGEIPKEIKAKA